MIELPVVQAKDIILNACAEHGTVVLVGETGSGKTTQVPQFLMERRSFGGRIAVTQPRRVAAVSVARRVASERKCPLGHLVGYTIRFDDKTCKKTRLRYMTDGMLLREAMLDRTLKRYSVVILDEAHERSLNTDILFGIVKSAQQQRRKTNMPLRVVVMSATLDVQMFLDYFSPSIQTDSFEIPIAIHVTGRQHKVQMLYTTAGQTDYVDSSVVSVLQIHEQEAPGDVLVFLTGQEEIEGAVELLEEKSRHLPSHLDKLLICPMFAALPAAEQLVAFEPTPSGTRKIVLATNIAETSITISGIRYVVDPGMVKIKSFSPASGLELLQVAPVSQEQAWQRAGRAGREGPGKCFRLYCEKDFLTLKARSVPEIKRVELSQVVLQLLTLGVSNVVEFDFIESPGKESLKQAMFRLLALGAIEIPSLHEVSREKISPQPRLTIFGKQMAALPLEPMHAKFLIESVKYKCTQEALTIAAMLSVEAPFYTPRNLRREANDAHKRFTSYESDHLTLLNLYSSFVQANTDKKWCTSNFVKYGTLVKALKIRLQLTDMLKSVMALDPTLVEDFSLETSCGAEVEPILKCLVSSFSLCIAKRVPSDGQPGVRYKTLAEGLEVRIHPSSCLSRRDPMPEWLVFNELVLTSKKYLKGVAAVSQSWLLECSPTLFSKKIAGEEDAKRKLEATVSQNKSIAQNSKQTKMRKLLMCD